MARPKFVQIPPHDLDQFRNLLGDEYLDLETTAMRARRLFSGRAIWHISSTLRGGGVAEMLRTLLPYVRGAGIDTRWVVLREGPEFFELTKRIHNNLHGDHGDGGPLGAAQRKLYEKTLAASARHLTSILQAGDVVFLHDPQTAGLAPLMREAGATVVWRCHVGLDRPDPFAHRAWDFLRPDVELADAWVFSRQEYVWDGLDPKRTWIVSPSIDPFAPKNQDLSQETVRDILSTIGLGEGAPRTAPGYLRADRSPARVERRAEVVQEERLPSDAILVAQISRWDRLKDHLGLLVCFERHLAAGHTHLLLAGPAVTAVADDPEGAEVWHEVGRARRELPFETRRKVHLASLPMADLEENAAMVNALQRRADIVVQKSIAEGFGLTVTEAMWKGRPVVGTRVGGIQDQIVDGESGLLVDDPLDLCGLAQAIRTLAEDRTRATALGEQAHQRVLEGFLAPTRLRQYGDLLAGLLGAAGADQ